MIIAGNFKTNHTRSSTLTYCKGLDQALKCSLNKVFLFPPISAMPYNDFSHFSIGAQNAYPIDSGAFTGEIGMEQLKEQKIKTLMIGHSERRTIMGENDLLCKKKFEFFSKQGMNLFFCIGENLEIREQNRVEEFLKKQLQGIDLSYPKLIVAYEPIWAIGTGRSATLDQIEEIHCFLQGLGVKTSVYGGSVNADNAKEIMGLCSVDGVLVGGASLKLESFCEIIKQGEELC